MGAGVSHNWYSVAGLSIAIIFCKSEFFPLPVAL